MLNVECFRLHGPQWHGRPARAASSIQHRAPRFRHFRYVKEQAKYTRLHSVVKRYFRPWPDLFRRAGPRFAPNPQLCPRPGPTRINAEAQRTQSDAQNIIGLAKRGDRQPWAGAADFAAGHPNFDFFTRINRTLQVGVQRLDGRQTRCRLPISGSTPAPGCGGMRPAARFGARGVDTDAWSVPARTGFPRGAKKPVRGAHPPPGVAGCAPQPAVVRAALTRTLDRFRRERVFREARKTAPAAFCFRFPAFRFPLFY